MRPTAPTFEALSDDEIRAFLARHHVGRLAYSHRDRVDIVPLNYVYDDGWLYGRTSSSPKLDTIAHSHWVAFEVDEVHGPFDWTSVVVRGTLWVLEPEGSDLQQEAYRRGVTLLRTLMPEAFGPDDPVPFRDVPFRIHVTEASGRRARSGG